MKKIGIVEFQHNHYDFVLSVYFYIDRFFPFDKVVIFITEEIYECLMVELEYRGLHIDKHKIKLIDSRSVKKSFLKIKEYNLDITIFNTIPLGKSTLHYINYFKKNQGRKYIGIHNLNSWFTFGKKRVKNLIRLYLKREILKKTSGIIVLNEQLKKNIKSKTSIPVISFPFKIPIDSLNIKNLNSEVTFVIPGSVEEGRRDYRLLLLTFKKIIKKQPKIKFIFLGQIKSQTVANMINDFELTSNVTYFKDYVDQQHFNKLMSNATFILAPLVKYFDRSFNTEVYGITKASGAEFDAIKYKKPLIIKSHYIVDSHMESSTMTFLDESDLQNIIINFLSDNELLESYLENALVNANYFTVDYLVSKNSKEYRDFWNNIS